MQLLCDQEHTYGAALRPAAGMGSGSRGRGDPAAVGGTAVLHRMVHYTWDRIREVGCECAHVLVSGCGCACVRARDSVCYNIRFSLSPILQLLVLGQALGFALWKTGVGMIKEKKWVALVTNSGDIFQEENQDDKICNSMLPWCCFFIVFSPHRREYCNEKPKAKYSVGRLNFPWTCWTSETCLLSSAEAAQPWQYTGTYIAYRIESRESSPCYTISYWLAVINRDRQHASSIPINCSGQE